MKATVAPWLRALLVCLALGPQAGWSRDQPGPQPQTHCQAGEVEYFSCRLRGSEKVASLCGSDIDPEAHTLPAWFQYRFGRPGHIEMAYPPGPPRAGDGSFASFEVNYFTPYRARNLYDVRFATGPYRYSVEFFVDEREASVGVSTRRRTVSSRACRLPFRYSADRLYNLANR